MSVTTKSKPSPKECVGNPIFPRATMKPKVVLHVNVAVVNRCKRFILDGSACGVSEDDDQFVDTNVERGRRISIDIEDINQYRPRSVDTKISIDAETGDVIDLTRRYRDIVQRQST